LEFIELAHRRKCADGSHSWKAVFGFAVHFGQAREDFIREIASQSQILDMSEERIGRQECESFYGLIGIWRCRDHLAAFAVQAEMKPKHVIWLTHFRKNRGAVL
jgi:hypothetical protein